MQSRYEGPDLEILLEQVRSELGTGTKIVSANKIRAGGIAGFFARERFEVIVEHDGIVTPPPGIADDPSVSVRPRDIAAPTLMDLVDQVSDAERAMAPRISTESEPFASVLQRIADGAGVVAARPATGGDDDVAAAADEAEVGDTDHEPDDIAAGVPATATAPPAVVDAAPVVAPAAAMPLHNPVTLPAAGGHVGALVKMGLPASFVPAVSAASAVEPALRASLTRLPAVPPLPRSTGSVVAVVGERNAALEVARDLSAQAGLDPDSITVATRRRLPARTPDHLVISGSDDAAEKRRSWRRRERPSVVVIDSDLGRDKQAWAYHVLAALEPEATWGVVDATRKTEDVAAWVNGLGGVDALAVNDLDATASPAAVLQLEIPVGRLDGRPASPALWAALLTERIAA